MDLAVCIPTRDSVPAGFAACLSNLTAELTKKKIEFSVNMIIGTTIADTRNKLVKQALNSKPEYTLWLDSDMHFPSDIFFKLKKSGKDVVGCTYSTRVNPQRSVAFIDEDDFDLRLTETSGVHPVHAVGFGCMLVKTHVFEKIKSPWFYNRWDELTETLVGEDIVFCENAAQAGYAVYVDVDVSKHVGHYGNKIYLLGETNEYSSVF